MRLSHGEEEIQVTSTPSLLKEPETSRGNQRAQGETPLHHCDGEHGFYMILEGAKPQRR